MNGYKLMADSYRKALESHNEDLDIENIKDNIRIFDMLAELKKDDKYIIFDSSMFNDIFKGYIELIIGELEEDYSSDIEKGSALDLIRTDIRDIGSRVLDMYNSKQAEDYYNH